MSDELDFDLKDFKETAKKIDSFKHRNHSSKKIQYFVMLFHVIVIGIGYYFFSIENYIGLFICFIIGVPDIEKWLQWKKLFFNGLFKSSSPIDYKEKSH